MSRAVLKRFGLLVLAVLAMASPLRAAAAEIAAPPPLPVIIDTDVGDDIDDAFALVLALSDPRLKVIGITTAYGDTRARVLLVRRLLATLGRTDVVVAQGPATSDTTPFTQARWAAGAQDTAPAPDAVAFLDEQTRLHPGQISLIALAPLTNIAALQKADPLAVLRFKQVVLMGGSVHAGYQRGGAIPVAEPSAEYNIAMAPKAFEALLASGVPVKVFPLDSTQLKFDEVRRDRLFAHGSPGSDDLALLYHQWRLLNGWGQITPTLFDVIPVVWMLEPADCPLTPIHLVVDDKGYTRPIPGPANALVCLRLDEGRAQALIMDHLAPEPATPTPGAPAP